jgi:hypothetical protein
MGEQTTYVVAVDPATEGAVVVMRHPHASDPASFRAAILGMIDWRRPTSGGTTLETGSLAGACAAAEEIRLILNKDRVDPERDLIYVRSEAVYIDPKRVKGSLGPSMALGCFLPLARPIGYYELVAADAWRKWHGWVWARGREHRERAKEMAVTRARQLLGQTVVDHVAEALCLAMIPPPSRVLMAATKKRRRRTK